MLIWPKQLEALNDLAAKPGLSSIDLVSMPLSLKVTASYTDGSYIVQLLDFDGKPKESLSEVLGC